MSIDLRNARPTLWWRHAVDGDHFGEGSFLRQRPRLEVTGNREVTQYPDADPRLRQRYRCATTQRQDQTGDRQHVNDAYRPVASVREACALHRLVGASHDRLGATAHHDEHDQDVHRRHDVNQEDQVVRDRRRDHASPNSSSAARYGSVSSASNESICAS